MKAIMHTQTCHNLPLLVTTCPCSSQLAPACHNLPLLATTHPCPPFCTFITSCKIPQDTCQDAPYVDQKTAFSISVLCNLVIVFNWNLCHLTREQQQQIIIVQSLLYWKVPMLYTIRANFIKKNEQIILNMNHFTWIRTRNRNKRSTCWAKRNISYERELIDWNNRSSIQWKVTGCQNRNYQIKEHNMINNNHFTWMETGD